MNAETLLSVITQAAFIFIFCAVLMDATHRGARRLTNDAVLFFAALTGIITVSALIRLHLITPSTTTGSISASLLLIPSLPPAPPGP